jgi:hypothetical protein
MSVSGEVIGTMPDIGMFGFWEMHALRYTAGSPNFGSYLAHRKDWQLNPHPT